MPPIGLVPVPFPEMIALDNWRLDPTPYGAYSNTESSQHPVAEGPETGKGWSAGPAIGSPGRLQTSPYA